MVNANLIRICGRVLGFTAALWVLVEVAENLGLSLVPVIAGLGTVLALAFVYVGFRYAFA